MKEDDADDPLLSPDEINEKCVEQFFEMFKVNSEGSSIADNVNIVWLLYAVPTKVLG